MRRSRGFTLVELMFVIAIVGVLTVVAMFSTSGYGNAQSTAQLARGIQFLMLRARTDAVADNHQRQVVCTPTAGSTQGVCKTYRAVAAGTLAIVAQPSNAAGWLDDGDKQSADSRAVIWNVTATTDYSANNAGGTMMSTTRAITFYPDGSADPATVYVADKNARRDLFKIYLYPATGMARLVNAW